MARFVDIDSPAVVHLLGNLDSRWKPHHFCGEDVEELSSVVEALEKLAVDAEPVTHGMWTVPDINFSEVAFLKCSECDTNVYLAKWMQYCPHCGARMDGE